MSAFVAKSLEDLDYLPNLVLNLSNGPELEAIPEIQNEPPYNDPKNEELLLDLLYGINALMGKGGVWYVPTGPAGRANCVPGRKVSHSAASSRRTTVPQLIQSLKDIFTVDHETIERLRLQVEERKPVAVTLHLMVKEARVFCRRDVKGPTSTHVTVVLAGNPDHRTRTERDTLYPKWMETFDLLINDLQRDHLLLELWQQEEEVEETASQRLFHKLVRNTHAAPVLLSSFTYSLKDIVLAPLDGWYVFGNHADFENDSDHYSTKVRLSGSLSAVTDLTNINYKTHGALLKLVLHHLLHSSDTIDINKRSAMWNGTVPDGISAVIAQHALLLNLSMEAQQLLWWSTAVQAGAVDAIWTLAQLKAVQSSLVLNLYSSEEQLELCSSLCFFRSKCLKQIQNLDIVFPITSDHSKLQLSSTLKALQSLHNHPQTRQLLSHVKQSGVNEDVTKAIKQYADQWWRRTCQPALDKAASVSEQCNAALTVTEEVLFLLKHHSKPYNDIFMQEMDIRAVMYIYETVVSNMVEALQPVVADLQSKIISELFSENRDDKPQCDFGLGSSLFKVFKNLDIISLLNLDVPPVIKTSTGVDQYYQWFIPAVESWLHSTNQLAYDHVLQAIQRDSFTPIDFHNSFSQSSKETTAIFHSIKVWWHKLSWPDPSSRSLFLLKTLENMYSLCIYYVDTLCKTTDRLLEEYSNGLHISEKVCIALQNIDEIQKEMERLPEIFGIHALVTTIIEEGNESLAVQINSNEETLTSSKLHDMKVKTHDFMDVIINKMKATIDKSIDDANEFHESSLLLKEVLDPSVVILRNGLQDHYFQHFLWGFWKATLSTIASKISINSKREYVYFETMHKILQELFKFFTPESGGLDPTLAKTPDYASVLDHLEIMRMDSNRLIANYCQERYDEQTEATLPVTGLLVIRAFYKDADHLAVRIIMARDIVASTEEDARSLPLEYFVKLQLQPPGWFPKATKAHTKILKEDPATFDEEFEFDISGSDTSQTDKGMLLLTLKDKNRIYSDIVLGEAFVSLSNIPSDLSEVKNSYLHLNLLSKDRHYRALDILLSRKSDNTANHFIKKICKRYPELHLNRTK
ncbi:protein unc-13 homolog D [Procambarus clarkii]|uniref:protein unc-13 homolog D n=1 Tax=Procambarus clarkii TaxID=6728 RepID=UPI00374397D0